MLHAASTLDQMTPSALNGSNMIRLDCNVKTKDKFAVTLFSQSSI